MNERANMNETYYFLDPREMNRSCVASAAAHSLTSMLFSRVWSPATISYITDRYADTGDRVAAEANGSTTEQQPNLIGRKNVTTNPEERNIRSI